ncbi:MAG TPA: efflux transporter outer membrane subunit [Bryobacteraceae bacterium]|nr:efflux transporter outer membrane subunit [Bryobacteraceae bacterium]
MKRAAYLAVCSFSFILASCTVGPNYKRPRVEVPTTYRNPSQPEAPQAHAASLGDEKWWEVFQDPELQKLVHTAIQQNYNVQIAASRVIQARNQVTITRSNQFPNVSGRLGYLSQRNPSFPPLPSYEINATQLQGAASWDVDFWGRYRRATEAARAGLLSTEWAQRAVISSLVANVAAAYFQLRELDLQLEIAKRTLSSRQESVKLTETLVNGGATSLVDLRQAQQLVETAAASIPDIERQIQQQENLIKTLLGENPGEIVRGRRLTDEPLPPTIPAGLPSALLERRPDVREAEQNLIAANAQIGVARAQLYPDISLTGSGGSQTPALMRLFTSGAGIWSLSGAVTQPIFTAGRLRANVRLSEAQQQEALFNYKQTVQQAFSNVSDALIGYSKYRQFREHEQALAAAAKDASDLANTRYNGGVTSYLEVLTNETNYFSAELSLAQAQLNERLSLVQIYNALGGGWQQ